MSRIHDALRRAEEKSFANLSAVTQGVETATHERVVESVLPPEVAAIVAAAPEGTRVKTSDSVISVTSLQNHPRTVWSPTKEALFLTANSSSSEGLEEFRTLRSKLFQLRAKRPLNTILVSSAVPGEGKSFVSANLAQAFARQKGGRTLLIDGDLRKPQLHEILGAPSSPGLVEYLAGDASESEIIQRSAICDELYFIAAGKVTETSAELIGTEKAKQLLKNLASPFNWVIIDSSPVGPVSDATRLAEFCNGVLLVVRAESTSYIEAEHAKRQFHQTDILGVVLNRSPEELHKAYSYNYNYRGAHAQ